MGPFIDLSRLDQINPLPGLKARMVHTDHQSIAFWEIDAGADLPAHHHPHEQTTIVTQGVFELTIDGETQFMTPGMVAVIPSEAVHSGRARTACEVIDVFYPAREDLK